MIFVDSSALVKRYIEEAGSAKVDALLNADEKIVVSRLAYAETLSALVRRRNNLDLSDEEFARMLADLRSEWQRFIVAEMDADALQYLDRVIETYALKGADSIHLSTAVWLMSSGNPGVTFVASDKELLDAARMERFKVIDPQDA